jgi:glycosyltransferase involved in cell wall biosynthesis
MPRRLRIAVLTRNFATTGGGAERYAIALVEQLAGHHEIHVYAQNIGHVVEEVRYHKVAMPLARPRWINQWIFATLTWWQTRRGFDVVHSHENSWHGDIQTVHVAPIRYSLFNGRFGATKILRWLKVATSIRLLSYLWLEQLRFSVGAGRRIVVTSESLREAVLQYYPSVANSLEVVTPGVAYAGGRPPLTKRQSARERLQLPQVGFALLFVGNDFKKKGLQTLLQSLLQLPSDTFLMVVGRSEQQLQTEAMVRDLGLLARVHFLQQIEQMGLAYSAADCLVHPTLEDSYAMVVLEAMGYGLPVVVSGPQYCGISRELHDAVEAVLLPDPRNVEHLVSAIVRVIGSVTFSQELSFNAVKFARHRSWEQVGSRYEAMLQAMTAPAPLRWLVLAHAFNMDGRAASQTITDKLPHLEKSGIETVILSGVSGTRDVHFEHHQLWPAAAAGIRFELRHVLRRHLVNRWVYRTVMLVVTLPLLPAMLVEKLLRPVESSWSWWVSAFWVGRRLARKNRFDMIYSTGGALAAHIAGSKLKHALGVPWLAEIHDPLVEPGTAPGALQSAQKEMQARVEADICRCSDLAVWFTQAAHDSARVRHPELGGRGRMMVPGVDRPKGAVWPYARGQKLVFGHFGSLSPTRNLLPVLGALEMLLKKRPELAGRVEFHVYGGPLDMRSEQALQSSSVRRQVVHFGRIEHNAASGLSGREQIVHRMRAADVLILLHGTDPICAEYIPSKLYEYFWMQRPIVALVHENQQMLDMILQEGHVALPTQRYTEHELHSALAQVMEQLADRWDAQGLPDNGKATPYTTESSVRQLVQWTADLRGPC